MRDDNETNMFVTLPICISEITRLEWRCGYLQSVLKVYATFLDVFFFIGQD
jgi:hypothetical protein